VFDRNAVSAVDKAIKSSDLGLNPQIDGNLLRLPIPALTEDRRRDLVKYAHKIAEEGKVAIRNVRRDVNDMIKELEKEHEVSEDASHDTMDKVQKFTNKYIEQIDSLLKNKEKEIMED
jgi:ribosome recycling factor